MDDDAGCVALDKRKPVWFCDLVTKGPGRTLVKCTNEQCNQYDVVKSILPMYLGNGVKQRIQPVCMACDGLRDMAIVESS